MSLHASSRCGAVLGRSPFSDLSASKLQLAVVQALVGQGDYILLQATCSRNGDLRAIALKEAEFVRGGCGRTSFVRFGRLFSAGESVIVRPIGQLASEKIRTLVSAVEELLRRSR